MQTFSFILKRLNEKMQLSLPYPLEVYIAYFTSCIPAVPSAFYKLSFDVIDCSLEIKPPQINQLPLCDISFDPLVRHLTPEKVMNIINYLLLERPILFVSENIEVLHPVMESLLVLIFPFKYQLIYVPVLPHTMIDLLQTECPYFIGMHDSLLGKVKSSLGSKVLIVHLEGKKMQNKRKKWLESDVKNITGKVVEMPNHKKLLNLITTPFSKLNAQEKLKNEYREAAIAKIREAFFGFLVGLLSKSSKFLHIVKGEYRVKPENLNRTSEKYRNFLLSFITTEMFKYWLHSKGHPKSTTEFYNNLLFEEHLIKKQNKAASIGTTKKVNLVFNYRVLHF